MEILIQFVNINYRSTRFEGLLAGHHAFVVQDLQIDHDTAHIFFIMIWKLVPCNFAEINR
jgi:hypothetical protein